MTLTDAEWSVMEVLWSADRFSLGEASAPLAARNGWSKKTAQTYLTRMCAKGLVSIDKGDARPYRAAVSRDACARHERTRLLRAYDGAAGDLIAAFLRESSISREEIDRLRELLDEMEV